MWSTSDQTTKPHFATITSAFNLTSQKPLVQSSIRIIDFLTSIHFFFYKTGPAHEMKHRFIIVIMIAIFIYYMWCTGSQAGGIPEGSEGGFGGGGEGHCRAG